jgi:hypothetical protein
MDLDQEKLQWLPREVNEVIASFAEIYARMAELQRVLERTCRRSEGALARISHTNFARSSHFAPKLLAF